MQYKHLNQKTNIKYLLLSSVIHLDRELGFKANIRKYRVKVLPLNIPELTSQTVGKLNNNIKFEVRSKEGHHNVAHFHITIKGEGQGSYRIDNLQPIVSDIDTKTEKIVLKWAEENRQLLVNTWNHYHGQRITVS